MTSFFAAVLLLGGVIALIKVFGVFPRAWQALRTSRNALDVISDPGLGEDRKESLLKRYSLSVLSSCLDLLIRGAGSVAIPVGVLWGLEFFGVVSLRAVLDLTVSWPFLLGGALAGIAAFCFLEK